MKIYALTTVFIFLLCGLATSQTSKQLEQAYKQQSVPKLKKFLDSWAKSFPPATKEEIDSMSKPIREAYRLYEVFYNPHDIKNRGGSEFGSEIYTGLNYFIIQNEFKIYQKDKVYYTPEETRDYIIKNMNKGWNAEDREKFLALVSSGTIPTVINENYGPSSHNNKERGTLITTVTDFRPSIKQTKATPLFVNNKYLRMLDSFLGNSHTPLGVGGIMNVARAKDESANRQKFLQNYVKIFYGHWGGYWQYFSYPAISSITFDKDMQYARIDYSMIYEGGEAILEKQGNGWKLLSMVRTWIQ